MRHRLGLLGFLALFVVPLVGSSHLYLAHRLVLDPGFPPAGLWLLALGAGTVLAAPVARRRLSPGAARALLLAAATWLGVSFVLVVATAVSDLGFALLGFVVPPAEAGPRAEMLDPRLHAFAALGLASLGCAVGLVSALSPPAVRRLELTLSRWPAALDGFRIVQLSDVHLGPIRGARFAADLVARVNALEPDLVAITGDLVDGRVEHVGDSVAPLRGLRAPHGVFFVTGNHEHLERADPWVARLAALGLVPLRNRRARIGAGEASFDLAGVEDRYSRHLGHAEGESLERALAGRDPRRAVVLLAHNPSVFAEAAAAGVDLQLSGHTHGGQIWPFGWVVRCFIPWVAGSYEKNGSRLYVSRGTGFWGPPLRLFAPAEITEITLRAEGAGRDAGPA